MEKAPENWKKVKHYVITMVSFMNKKQLILYILGFFSN